MREHKYKAWDKNLEFMIDPAFLSLDGNGLIAVFYENCDDEESLWVTDPTILENIELLEYTSLKDKNGTEIYEGDIVKADYAGDKQVVKSVFDFAQLLTGWDSNYEVIGNIYSNPELLK